MYNSTMFVRSVIGFALSLTLMLMIMPKYIRLLKKNQLEQSVSEYALDEFKNKEKTPIMGGLLFVLVPSVIFVIVDFKSLLNTDILLILFSYILFAIPGFIDDYTIIKQHNNEGISPKSKLILEAIIAIVLLIFSFIFKGNLYCFVRIPFIDSVVYVLPIIFSIFIIIMYLGEANAVNFTDGMDGLCAGVSVFSLIGFMFIGIFYSLSDIVILISCIIGALFGYLRFNWHPAKIFMGDSGSLALGGLFASLALTMSCEIPLLFLGGIFLFEMICVCIQQVSVRLFHKRVFRYTPIHYAFSLKGYKETKIVIGFCLVQIIFTLIGIILGIL